ncbi:MAG: hypothetical protein M1820_010441 [Bogoriella megaspora]|nr:MAG: hypothetical protein M1820_010441 [Bogoriella megaspora]
MSEFIGSRISLISKSDIRYVGTLHEINSENSSVALENVKSFGTEGRKANPAEEIPASDNVYEYIVFRGSDVKDLRIEEPPKENKPPPKVPDDPAILGSGSRPPAQQPGPQSQQAQQFRPGQQQNFPQQPFGPYGGYPPFQQQQGSRFAPPGGPHGFPGTPGGIPSYPGFNGGPPGGFGAPPPGWYPNQGFPPNQGPFAPHPPPNNIPIGPPGQQQADQPQQPSPIGAIGQKDDRAPSKSPAKPITSQPPEPQAPTAPSQQAPPPPVESKPDAAAALAPAPISAPNTQTNKPAPTGPKGARGIIPAIPIASPNTMAKAAVAAAQPTANNAIQDATQAATAAVAAAMAKLPPPSAAAGGKAPATGNGVNNTKSAADGDAVQNLAKKVSEMRVDANIRHGRQPGTGGYAAATAGTSERGGRGRGRGRGRGGHDGGRGIEVPKQDYDFEAANQKFNKQDLVKEAIASGSPIGTPGEDAEKKVENGANGTDADASPEKKEEVVIPPVQGYNKSSSFFDDISSDLKDREETKTVNGREIRSEERKKNFETFGQTSVDGGFRGGYRGRGRGRGGYRGRGYGRGGGYRGRGGTTAPPPNGTVTGMGA